MPFNTSSNKNLESKSDVNLSIGVDPKDQRPKYHPARYYEQERRKCRLNPSYYERQRVKRQLLETPYPSTAQQPGHLTPAHSAPMPGSPSIGVSESSHQASETSESAQQQLSSRVNCTPKDPIDDPPSPAIDLPNNYDTISRSPHQRDHNPPAEDCRYKVVHSNSPKTPQPTITTQNTESHLQVYLTNSLTMTARIAAQTANASLFALKDNLFTTTKTASSTRTTSPATSPNPSTYLSSAGGFVKVHSRSAADPGRSIDGSKEDSDTDSFAAALAEAGQEDDDTDNDWVYIDKPAAVASSAAAVKAGPTPLEASRMFGPKNAVNNEQAIVEKAAAKDKAVAFDRDVQKAREALPVFLTEEQEGEFWSAVEDVRAAMKIMEI